MEQDKGSISNSRISTATHAEEHLAETGSSAKSVVRVVLLSLVLTCVWLTVRFPYEAESGLEYLLSGPNRINPQTLHLRGEFVESSLGPAEESGGGVTVRMIAEQYLFVPQCVVVPTGVPLRVRITSADVVHELTVNDTGDEIKAVPGYVVESHLEFKRAGEYPMHCLEFCGPGHYTMRSRLIAVPLEQFRLLSREARISCARQ
jgi:cytochrome c oxidase subunit II